MFVFNNESFLPIRLATQCYYQTRYKYLNSDKKRLEQKLIDNMEIFYSAHDEILITEQEGCDKKEINLSTRCVPYEGFLKFKKNYQSLDDIESIAVEESNIFITTEFSDKFLQHLADKDATLIKTNTSGDYLCEDYIYVKLSSLIKLAIANGIQPDKNFYAPVIIDSYEFTNLIRIIGNNNLSSDELINTWDYLKSYTYSLNKEKNPTSIKDTLDNAISLFNSHSYCDDCTKDHQIPSFAEINSIINHNRNSINKDSNIKEITRLISDLPPTEEYIEEMKKLLPSSWSEALLSSPTINQEVNIVDFESDDIPNLLYFAYSVYKEVWNGFNSETTNLPSKTSIEDIVKNKGINEIRDIAAIIRLSTPNGVTLGGKPSKEKKDWLPLLERKKH